MGILSTSERHQTILKMLEDQDTVSVSLLSDKLKVSTVTVRKDLRLLESKGLLHRFHGGASRDNPYINEVAISEKEHIHADEKSRIGEAAAKLINGDNAIIIASGTTVLAFARQIKPIHSLITITSSLNVALELNKHVDLEVIQLGGILRKSSFSVTGPYGEGMLDQFSCSKLFIGVDGLSLDFGITTASIQEAHLNQKMMDSAQKTIVLTDSSKFGKRGFGKICNLEEIDTIITDSAAPDHYIKALEEMGVEIILV